ncbi:cytochrome P450 3A27-like isoform X2 [Brachionichthys hirsutus]|uniref:cytochrome P450 3A27-like isoform X2 n=1 Tax=Brachionichthys hirsutus TaxID=412623 RepID=UPI0036044DB3
MALFPNFSIETWTLTALIITLILVYGYAPYGFFKKIGIQGPKPWPFVGTFLEYRKGVHYFDMECYKKYGKVWGLYDGRQPLLCVMDTEVIKTILIKECYSNFINRRDFGLNGPLRDSLSVVGGEHWRRIRNTLSPSFTSGRLKEMYGIMLQHSGNLINIICKKVKADEVIEVKEVFGPYSIDIVTSSAFSVDVDSINRPADPFAANVKRMVKFSLLNPLIVIVVIFPFLVPVLEKMNVSLFPTRLSDFFSNFLKTIKSDRNKTECKNRVDFMQLMVEAQISEQNKEDPVPWCVCVAGLTDDEILAQALVFILAGYETTTNSLGFLAYNLATHPQIQKTLQEEIDRTFPQKGHPSYDALVRMEYLDMVVSETMRLYPFAPRLDRISNAAVEIHGVTIPKGTVVVVPVYTLQHDPLLWSDPEAFQPERFSKENRCNIEPYAFLPFGAGPRNCIGMRFAILMMKLAMVEILQSFSFVTCKETDVPMELAKDAFAKPKNPIKLKLEPREAVAAAP